MHTYPEYDSDVREAFADLAKRHSLVASRFGTMPSYVGARIEIRIGIDAMVPEVWVQLQGRKLLTLDAFLAERGARVATRTKPGATSREIARERLRDIVLSLSRVL